MRRKFTAAALLLVLILMLTLACSGDDSPAAPDTDRTQQELLRTIERMGEQIDSLQQEMEESKRTKDAEEAECLGRTDNTGDMRENPNSPRGHPADPEGLLVPVRNQ